ncbi:G-type lectin S-receptor-like serine/threonine-protein kinase [Sesamum angolense]|uniref:Receptor-like serine/threonine-protein kinase n=1 Tax=Sesamum angolense TaxID=2727404 RepID=A0AAE2BU67_9LAMI|nr:G-type lectin S-receptor-like serine/threonine-protein kinase [Sesamum angolense]
MEFHIKCWLTYLMKKLAADILRRPRAGGRRPNCKLASDTISGNATLSGDQTIVSSGGNFELGFFTPVLLNESQTKIWSTDTNSTALDVVAVLLDDGNLVLRGGSESNSSIGQPLWESLDNPADTWLPGGKIAYNKRTRTKQLLTSWSNSEDPAPGLFSLELDPDGRQYIIRWNRSEQYWTSGAWNGHIFSLVPEMRLNYIYNFSYMDNDNESYFTYSLYNPSIISRFIMDVSGQIKQLSWDNSDWNLFWSQPRQQCEVYAYCGAFGTCNQNSLPFCDCLPGFKHKSENDWNLRDYSGGCVRETNLQCGNNSTNSNGRRDKFFQLNVGDGNGKTIYIRLSASSSVFSGAKKSKGAIIGAILGSIAVIVLLVAIVMVVIWRRRRQTVGSSKPVEGSLVAFAYKDLQNATKNFSEKLGGGGFGSVFKGTLPDSSVIAVKKLESISQGEKQFRTEVSTIGTIQHVNLVRLRGFCSEGSKKLLVYDYMENSSLNSHLFHADESKVLEWRTRYEIALGVARGLSYLHEKCRDCIIHCDIKPENILLDAEFCPKVADFGLAKLVGPKADVYYGMLFELVSGRRNSENSEDGKVKFYPAFAARVTVDGGDVLGLLDPLLDGNADVEEVLKVCKVASWCIQDDENTRPSMGQVVQILEGLMDVNLPPIPRSLQVFVESEEHIIFFTDSSSADQSSQPKSNTSSASAHSKTSTSSAN